MLHGKLNTSSKKWEYKTTLQKIFKQVHMTNQWEEEKFVDLTTFKTEIEQPTRSIGGSWETHRYRCNKSLKCAFFSHRLDVLDKLFESF